MAQVPKRQRSLTMDWSFFQTVRLMPTTIIAMTREAAVRTGKFLVAVA
jgi:hypothetical protein